MDVLAALRPRRSLALPLLVFAVPTLYFVYRDAAMGCRSGAACPDPAYAGYALAALAGSYLLAVAALALVDAPSLAESHPYARLALRPTDRTLAFLGIAALAISTYLVATLVATIPAWLDLALTPLGLLVGLPLVVVYGGMTVVASALSTEPSLPMQSAVVALSLGLTGAWLFALATGASGLLASVGALGAGSN